MVKIKHLMAYDFIAVPNIFPQKLPIYLICTWLQLIIALIVTRRSHLKSKKMSLGSKLIIRTLIFRINREKHFWRKTHYLTLRLNSLSSCLSKSTLDSTGSSHNPAPALSTAGFPRRRPAGKCLLQRLSISSKMMFNSQQGIRTLQCTDWSRHQRTTTLSPSPWNLVLLILNAQMVAQF